MDANELVKMFNETDPKEYMKFPLVKDVVPGLDVRLVHSRNNATVITPMCSLSVSDRDALKRAGYKWNRSVGAWIKDK